MPEPRTFATYLDRTERDQLDARAATAEAERDEATEDRDLLRAENANLTAGLRRLREQLADMTDQRNERLTLAESSRLAKRYDEAEEARDCARQLAAFRQGVIDRHRQELEDANTEIRRLFRQRDQARAAALGSPRRAQEATETDVPDWVLELIRGLAKYEAEHPKLYRHKGVDQVEPYPCPCSLLEGVPKTIREQARP